MDRLFDGMPLVKANWPTWRPDMPFVPAIEVLEKNGVMLVKADVPGLKKEEVSVEVAAEGLTITGERTYGTFSRFVPLPEGALIDKAIATVKDGVLEVQIPLPKLEKVEAKKLPIL